MKLCVDCRHCSVTKVDGRLPLNQTSVHDFAQCRRFGLSLVDGTPALLCASARLSEGMCGTDAHGFEARGGARAA